jgi:hypothetical protein
MSHPWPLRWAVGTIALASAFGMLLFSVPKEYAWLLTAGLCVPLWFAHWYHSPLEGMAAVMVAVAGVSPLLGPLWAAAVLGAMSIYQLVRRPSVLWTTVGALAIITVVIAAVSTTALVAAQGVSHRDALLALGTAAVILELWVRLAPREREHGLGIVECWIADALAGLYLATDALFVFQGLATPSPGEGIAAGTWGWSAALSAAALLTAVMLTRRSRNVFRRTLTGMALAALAAWPPLSDDLMWWQPGAASAMWLWLVMTFLARKDH